MELKEIRVGNYVRESEYSSRERTLQPFYRVELNDLSYYHFMNPIKIDKEWCERLKMFITYRVHPTGNYDWIAEAGGFTIVGLNDEISVRLQIGGGAVIFDHIIYVHLLQNLFYFYYQKEIDELN